MPETLNFRAFNSRSMQGKTYFHNAFHPSVIRIQCDIDKSIHRVYLGIHVHNHVQLSSNIRHIL